MLTKKAFFSPALSTVGPIALGVGTNPRVIEIVRELSKALVQFGRKGSATITTKDVGIGRAPTLMLPLRDISLRRNRSANHLLSRDEQHRQLP